jgi:hypothetical protein
MASVVTTTNLRVDNCKKLFNDLLSNRDVFYFFIAKPSSWSDEDNPDSNFDSQDLNLILSKEILALKKVGASNLTIGAKRYNWESGNIYQYYDDKNDIFDYTDVLFSPFYVVNSQFQVFKCLWNGAIRESFVINKLTFDGSSGSVVNTSTNVITSNDHGFESGTKVYYSPGSGTAIGSLTSGTVYYVVNSTQNTFQLSLTVGGGAVALGTLGTGTTHTLLRESVTLASFTYTPATDEILVFSSNKRKNFNTYIESSTTTIQFVSGAVKEGDVITVEKRGYSTIEPTVTSLNSSQQTVELADGYRWKYMFSISPADSINFLTKNWIPVGIKMYDDGTDQFDIQTNALDGIDTVVVLKSGSGYGDRIYTGNAASGSSTTIVLDGGASASDNHYTGMSVYIVSGQGAGQIRTISNYVGSTKTATVAAWGVTPNSSSVFEICPTLTITSNTGTGMVARIPYSKIVGGKIQAVSVLEMGSGYKDATITVSGVPAVGSGAEFSAILSPKYGHGHDAQKELGASALICNINLDGSEAGEIVASNDYRKVGIIKNPISEKAATVASTSTTITLDASSSATNDFYINRLIKIIDGIGYGQKKLITGYNGTTKVATIEYGRTEVDSVWDSNALPTAGVNGTTGRPNSEYGIVVSGNIYNQTVVLTYTGSGSFVQDEEVTQNTTNAKGIVIYQDTVASKLYVLNTSGIFEDSYNVVGGSANVAISAVELPSVLTEYGECMIVQNRKKISRSDDQKEEFKVILEF